MILNPNGRDYPVPLPPFVLSARVALGAMVTEYAEELQVFSEQLISLRAKFISILGVLLLHSPERLASKRSGTAAYHNSLLMELKRLNSEWVLANRVDGSAHQFEGFLQDLKHLESMDVSLVWNSLTEEE